MVGPTAPSGKETTSTLGVSSKSGNWERKEFKAKDMEESQILYILIQCGMGSWCCLKFVMSP